MSNGLSPPQDDMYSFNCLDVSDGIFCLKIGGVVAYLLCADRGHPKTCTQAGIRTTSPEITA